MRIFGKAAVARHKRRVHRRTATVLGAVAATAILGLMAPVPSAHAQVIFNEDFSGGNPVTSTDYTLVNAGVFTVPGQYRVVNNPSTAFTNGYTSYFDHTLGTAAGAMLFFDGSNNSATRIFYRSGINLTVGTQYTFSFWGSSGSNSSVPALNVLIDGFGLGAANLTTANGAWTQFSVNYTPTFVGPHTFAIYDTNTEGNGNDGAIDDVRLVGPAAAPEPASLVLFVPFAGGAAGLMRLRRKRA